MNLIIMEWLHKIFGILSEIGDFFVLMWNDEERWICIAGFIIVVVTIFYSIIKMLSWIFGIFGSTSSSVSRSNKLSRRQSDNCRLVKIKGVYQMNGPKPFQREIDCSQSEVGYYTQMMTDKSEQARWIKANFPGAQIGRGFSMTVNIK